MNCYFPSEFLGRLDEIILFDALGEREMKEIILLRLDEALGLVITSATRIHL